MYLHGAKCEMCKKMHIQPIQTELVLPNDWIVVAIIPLSEEIHFCSKECLAHWAMLQANLTVLMPSALNFNEAEKNEITNLRERIRELITAEIVEFYTKYPGLRVETAFQLEAYRRETPCKQ